VSAPAVYRTVPGPQPLAIMDTAAQEPEAGEFDLSSIPINYETYAEVPGVIHHEDGGEAENI